jgi:hypothetical protein
MTREKYIVIDTWNGEGYSSENGVDTRFFNDRNKAFQWAYKRALENADGQTDDVHQYSDDKYFKEKAYSNGDGYYYEAYDDNHGSYQVWKTKDIYAIMIQCNVNEVSMLTKKEYEEKVSQLNKEYGEDLEDNLYEDDNGDKFYCSLVDDYDYQFRLIKNL